MLAGPIFGVETSRLHARKRAIESSAPKIAKDQIRCPFWRACDRAPRQDGQSERGCDNSYR